MDNAASANAGTSAVSPSTGMETAKTARPEAAGSPLRSLGRRQIVKCWSTAAGPDGRRLTLHEIEILADRWVELFGEFPSTMPSTVEAAAGRSRGAARKAAPGSELVRKRIVAERLGVTPRALDRMVAEGRFPKPLRIGKRTAGWPRSQIDRLLGSADAEGVGG